MPTATKLELIRRLVDAGVRRVEVASFVNPKRVPQMADAEAVLGGAAQARRRSIRRPRAESQGIRSRARRRMHGDRHGRGGDRQLRSTQSGRVDRGNSSARGKRSRRWRTRPASARRSRSRLLSVVRSKVRCRPSASSRSLRRLAQVETGRDRDRRHDRRCRALTGHGADRADPASAVDDYRLRCHFHNTRNTAVANAYAAVQAGVRTLDASVGGIGGCPFAPNATGNVATEDLLYMMSRAGYRTGIDLDR